MHAAIISIIYLLLALASIRYLFARYMIFQLDTRIELKSVTNLLLKSAPLLISFFIAGIAEYIDAFLIKYNFGNAILTLYRYGAREIPFVMILANALSISMIPVIRNELKSGIVELKRRSIYLMHISFVGTIVLVLTCQWWYPILFNNQFLESIPFFLVSSLLIISRCIFPQTILQANRATKVIMYISIIELVLNIILSIYFLTIYGAIGVLYGTLISFTIEKILLSIYVKIKLRIDIKSYIPIGLYTFYILILLGSIVIQRIYLS
jgi:O-antigen/teichoic acid export membrane protein